MKKQAEALCTQIPHVLLCLSLSFRPSRDLFRGIQRYLRLHGPWAFHLINALQETDTAFNPKAWGCTGMIIDQRNSRMAARFMKYGLPSIFSYARQDLRKEWENAAGQTCLVCDNEGIARKAADFFLHLQFRHFAFLGMEDTPRFSFERENAFHSYLRQRGFPCEIYSTQRITKTATKRNSSPLKERARIAAWLKGLPRPTALFAANDSRAKQALDACQEAGIQVPEDLAVLGVDNDDLLCDTVYPSLSSIEMSTEQAGFDAAQALDRMMNGEKRVLSEISFGFLRLVERRSTGVLRVDDALVRRILEFIKLNSARRFSVNDLAASLHVSVRWMEKRFKEVMGHKLHEEILDNRIARAKSLLLESDLPVDQIAESCFFASASHLSTVLRRKTGMTPATFRSAPIKAHTSERPAAGPRQRQA